MGYKVYIDFTSPDKWFQPFAWAVRLFERTKYSHVRLRWNNTNGDELIYEASGARIKLIGLQAQRHFPVKIHHTYEFDLDRIQYRRLIGLFRYASVEYGTWQIIGIALARIFRLKKNPFGDGQYTQVCSELVGRFLTDVLEKKVDGDLDLVGPRGIKEFLDQVNSN